MPLQLQQAAINMAGKIILLLLLKVVWGWCACEACWDGCDFYKEVLRVRHRTHIHKGTHLCCHLQHCHIMCLCPWLRCPGAGLKWAQLLGVSWWLQAVCHVCQRETFCLTCPLMWLTTQYIHMYVHVYDYVWEVATALSASTDAKQLREAKIVLTFSQ